MPRRLRTGTAGLVFHVMNRAARRLSLFDSTSDYAAFERVLWEARQRMPMRLLGYAVMPNHWHLVLWPIGERDLSRYMHWVTMTHAQRWHLARGSSGTGAVYQGRFRAVPVQTDHHFLKVCRYVERNPARAHLVADPEAWRWSSAWQRTRATAGLQLLHDWPVPTPDDWWKQLNTPEPERPLQLLRRCMRRSVPFGADRWRTETTARLGWTVGARPRGRPPSHTTVS